MVEIGIDIDAAETSLLRDVYRNSLKDRNLESKWVGKMGRPELVKKLKALLKSGDIAYRQDEKKEEEPKEQPPAKGEASRIRNPMKSSFEDCLQWLMEAIRLYAKLDVWISSGRRDDPQTKKYLEDAREATRKAVGCAIDAKGQGWDNANKLAYIVDRAVLKMRNDFNDTLVSSCVMSALMSDEHIAKMERIQHG